MSCFTPERRHRISKRLCAFSFRNFTKTLLVRTTKLHIQTLEGVSFDSVGLVEAKPAKPSLARMLRTLGVAQPANPRGEVEPTPCSFQLRTPRGTVHRGDLVLLRGGGAGFAKFFALLRARPFAVVTVLPPLGGAKFSQAPDHLEQKLVPADQVVKPATYFVDDAVVNVVEGSAW